MTVDGNSQRSFRVIQVKEQLKSLTEKLVKVRLAMDFHVSSVSDVTEEGFQHDFRGGDCGRVEPNSDVNANAVCLTQWPPLLLW